MVDQSSVTEAGPEPGPRSTIQTTTSGPVNDRLPPTTAQTDGRPNSGDTKSSPVTDTEIKDDSELNTNVKVSLLDKNARDYSIKDQESPLKSIASINSKGSEHKPKITQQWIIRNLIILGLTWFLIFTAYSTLEILQSSLNSNLGVLAITLVYIFKVVSSLMGPYIIVKLSPKWTMVIGYACHSVFLIANFHPSWFILLPSSILLGFAMGPIWICYGVYVTVLGVKYATISGQSKSAVLSKFNGFMAMALPCSFILGLLLSSFIFNNVSFEETDDIESTTPRLLYNSTNGTHFEYSVTTASWLNANTQSDDVMNNTTQNDDVAVCGPHYCPDGGFLNKNDDTSNRPEDKVVYLLVGLLGIFNLIGLLLTIFGLGNLPQEDVKSGIKVASNVCAQVWLYLKAFFDWRFVILTPTITYMFFFLTMMNAMFPKAYITCSLGIQMVGYVSMTRGFTGMISNTCSGWLGQHVHRNYHFLFVFVCVILVIITWLLWDAWPNEIALLYVTAIVAGFCNGVNLTQFSAFLGYAFTERKTEAFSFFHFWSGIVTAAAFFCNNYVCTRHQFYMLLAVMVLAAGTFSYLSYYLHQSEKEAVAMEMSVDEENMALRDNKQGRNQKLAGRMLAGNNEELCASQLSLANC